jgi:hypothetical protein
MKHNNTYGVSRPDANTFPPQTPMPGKNEQ